MHMNRWRLRLTPGAVPSSTLLFLLGVLAAACATDGPSTSGPAARTTFTNEIVITFAPGDSTVEGVTPPGGATDQPPPTNSPVETLASATLHEVLPATLANSPTTRVDVAGGDPALAAILGVSPDAVEMATVSDGEGFPIGRAYRVSGIDPQAVFEAIAPPLTPPGATVEQGTVADRGVLIIRAPVGSTYAMFSGDAVVLLGGPRLTEADVEDLVSQVP
jgi:hypothetical protein